MSAKATGYLDLNISGFDEAIKAVKRTLVGLAGVFAAYKVGSFLKDGIADAITFSKEMSVAGMKMGQMDAGKLLIAQKALEQAGFGAEEARGKMKEFIDEGRNIAEIFGGSENYSKALKSAAEDYGSQADILTRSAKVLQQVWNVLESIGSKLRTFFMAMVEQFQMPLLAALELLNSIDLAEVGASFGASIAGAAEILLGLFGNGTMMETLKIGVIVAFQEGINYLVGGLKYAMDFLRIELPPIISKAMGVVMEYFTAFKAALPSIGDVLLGIAAHVTQFTLNTLNAIMLAIGKVLVNIVLNAGNIFMKAMLMAGKALSDYLVFVVNNIATSFKQMGEDLAHPIEAAKAALGLENNRKVVDRVELMQKTDTSYGDINDFVNKHGLKDTGRSFADIGKGIADKGKFSNAGDELLKGTGVGKVFDNIAKKFNEKPDKLEFKKDDMFKDSDNPTQALKDTLKGLLEAGQAKGKDMIAAVTKGKDKPPSATDSAGGTGKVIADSLAKVGGGGNFVRVGMSIAERTQVDILKTNRQQLVIQQAIADNTRGSAKTATMGR